MPSSEQTVTSTVLTPMKFLYRHPYKLDDETAALAEYVRVLRRFDREVLEEGWDRLVTTYKGKAWPSLGEIVANMDIVKQAKRRASDLEAPAELARDQAERQRRRAFADHVMSSELGRQSCAQGWNLGLFWFAHDNERFPTTTEIDAMRKARSGFDADLGKIAQSDFPLDRMLYRLGVGMTKARARMADQYHPEG